jgi:hypothetical protein
MIGMDSSALLIGAVYLCIGMLLLAYIYKDED